MARTNRKFPDIDQELRAAATLLAGANASHDLDMNGPGYDLAKLKFTLTLGASSGLIVEIRETVGTLPSTAQPSQRFVLRSNGEHVRNIADAVGASIYVENEDQSDPITSLAIHYAGGDYETT